jgi:hypothetical protein
LNRRRLSGLPGSWLYDVRRRDELATEVHDPRRDWLAINDGFGNVAHRYYVEEALAAGFHMSTLRIDTKEFSVYLVA